MRIEAAIAVGVGALAAYWLLRPRTVGAAAAGDVEWLARLITLEAGDIGPSDEWAGIMAVARNRAARAHTDVRSVVTTTAWPGGGARGRAFVEAIQQPGGIGYRSASGHRAPPDHPRWRDALAFADELVQSGRNPVGPREHFFHPGGMPRCDEGCGSNKRCVDGRCWPTWGIPRADGGTAEYPPIRVGRAIFS
jgi:hypothetical protein